MLSLSATRVSTVIGKYDCNFIVICLPALINTRLYMQLVQEMYHVMGQEFKTVTEVQQKVSSLEEHWSLSLVPAIYQLAKETGKVPPAQMVSGPMCIKFLTQVYTHSILA